MESERKRKGFSEVSEHLRLFLFLFLDNVLTSCQSLECDYSGPDVKREMASVGVWTCDASEDTGVIALA